MSFCHGLNTEGDGMDDESRRQLIDAYAADEMARRVLALDVVQTRLTASDTIVLSALAGAVGAGEEGAR